MRSSLLVCFTLLALSSFVATSPIAIPESAVTLSVNDVEAPEEAVLEARGLSKKQKAALAKVSSCVIPRQPEPASDSSYLLPLQKKKAAKAKVRVCTLGALQLPFRD